MSRFQTQGIWAAQIRRAKETGFGRGVQRHPNQPKRPDWAQRFGGVDEVEAKKLESFEEDTRL